VVSGFRTKIMRNRKRVSGAPKGALSNQCPRKARGGALLVVRRARLPALTLAALATGSTRWLSSRTGFPAAFADGGFARFAYEGCHG
jgi:hypothetical protein